jgi:hypothetical protein
MEFVRPYHVTLATLMVLGFFRGDFGFVQIFGATAWRFLPFCACSGRCSIRDS